MQTPIRPFADAAATQTSRLTEFAEMARLIATTKSAAAASRMAGIPQRIRDALAKAAIPALGGAGSAEATALTALGEAFLGSLRSVGVFDAMLGSMLQVPLNTRITISSTGMVAVATLPGGGKRVTSAALNLDTLSPTKVAGLVVLTDELARLTLSAGFIQRELRDSIAAATDSVFLAAMVAATTPISSAGSSAANTQTDFAALLGALTLAAGSRPFLVYSVAAVKALLNKTASGMRIWPDLRWPAAGINAGEMSGIPVLMSDQLPAGAALAVDASQVAGNGGEVAVDSSTEAALQMDTAPTNASTGGSPPAPVPTTLVSLFQTNSTAVRAERYFGYRLLRSGAAASLSGVAY